ncbi:hypothetical protein [Flavobacterium lacustre]|uniref:hypothetical protein n=1 Tax=Flavobacterium lacustre TaxID=3016339 RepID=UPI0022B6F923|nr:hypothetical protein [Flavobacterium lacustre]
MILKDLKIETATFLELVATTSANATNPKFDIIINHEINLEQYCIALLNKFFELPLSKYSEFINYQAKHLVDPCKWLSKLENLITKNEDLFNTKTDLIKYNKIFNLIEKKQLELQSPRVPNIKLGTPKRFINAESEDRYFSFSEAKKHIAELTNYPDKILYLNEEICEYKQSEVYFINNKLLDYRKQCKALLKQIQNEKILKCQLEKEQQDEKNKIALEIKPTFKIRLNGPINILTDAYKQMMNEVKPNGKPYIENKIKEIAKFICDNYLDEKGKELSILTIQTYLSPTRTDKNPNNDWKIKL